MNEIDDDIDTEMERWMVPQDDEKELRHKLYWQTNLRVVGTLLAIWFTVSYGAGILFAKALNQIHIGGFPVGFWFAQQGAIYVFVILIFVYVAVMNRLDQKFGVSAD